MTCIASNVYFDELNAVVPRPFLAHLHSVFLYEIKKEYHLFNNRIKLPLEFKDI